MYVTKDMHFVTETKLRVNRLEEEDVKYLYILQKSKEENRTSRTRPSVVDPVEQIHRKIGHIDTKNMARILHAKENSTYCRSLTKKTHTGVHCVRYSPFYKKKNNSLL